VWAAVLPCWVHWPVSVWWPHMVGLTVYWYLLCASGVAVCVVRAGVAGAIMLIVAVVCLQF
jgi:hypothetical protein